MSDGAAWYRQFWPWFLVVLMIVSMSASLATVFIAYGLGDLEMAEDGAAGVESSSPALEDSVAPDDGRP